MTLLQHLLGALAAGYGCLAMTGLGAWLLDRLRLPARPRVALVYSLALGTIVTGTLLLGLAAGQLWHPLVFAALAAAGAVPAGRAMVLVRRAGLPQLGFGWLLPGLLALCALAPPLAYDNLVYHLAVPAQFLKAGGLVRLENNFHGHFPLLGSFVTVPVMALAPVAAISFLGFLLALLFPAALVRMLSPLLRSRHRRGLHLLVLSTPLFVYLSTALIYDLLAASFAFLAFDLLRRARRHPVRKLALAGLFAGGALAVKYPAVFYVAPLVIPLIFGLGRAPRRAALAGCLCFGLAAGAVFGPWLLRNLWDTGNPTAPFHLFGPRDLAEQKFYRAEHLALPWRDLPAWWQATLQLRVDPLYGLAPLAVLLAAATGAAARLRRGARPGRGRATLAQAGLTLGYALAAFLLWYHFSGKNMRFVFPAVLLLTATGYAALTRGVRSRRPVAAAAGVVAALNLGLLFTVFPWFAKVPQAGLGLLTDAEYLGAYQRNPSYTALAAVNGIPGRFTVLFVGECRGFYCEKDLLAGSIFDRDILAELVARTATEEALLGELRRLGVAVILYNAREASHLKLGPICSPELTEEEKNRFRRFADRYLELLFTDRDTFLYRVADERAPPGAP